jgi:hypothetical protein
MKKVAYVTGDIGINFATNDKRSNWHVEAVRITFKNNPIKNFKVNIN